VCHIHLRSASERRVRHSPEPVRECFAELFRQRLPREKLSKEIRLLRDVRGLHAFHEGVRAITLDHNFAEQVFEQ
jgi:hypothetical protein